ncbi:MAG TPA: hypothetical protein PLD37_09495 [Usitatibacteraceae bacterium]|nr:hypothetical protein [Usitatibacteraceae bacterium]
MRWTLKALSLLLTYPDAELREKLPGLIAALETDAALARPHREALLALAKPEYPQARIASMTARVEAGDASCK